MPNWRDELQEAVKGKDEREAEDKERHRRRVKEALTGAEAALELALKSLSFAREKLADKQQKVELTADGDHKKLQLRDLSLSVELDRETAIIRITFMEQKPREFDFAKDRHIAPGDVEEYVGRRSVELVRAAQKAEPW